MFAYLLAKKRTLLGIFASALVGLALGFCASRPAHAQAGGFPISQGSFTYTVSAGCSTTPTGTAYYVKIAQLAHIFFAGPISCTSNTVTFQLTGWPANLTPARGGQDGVCDTIQDNSLAQVAPSAMVMGTSFAALSKNGVSVGSWTISGTKAFGNCEVTYVTN
jgi:hypothetical protein